MGIKDSFCKSYRGSVKLLTLDFVMKSYGSQLFSYLKYAQKMEIKIDLLVSGCEDTKNKINTFLLQNCFSSLKKIFRLPLINASDFNAELDLLKNLGSSNSTSLSQNISIQNNSSKNNLQRMPQFQKQICPHQKISFVTDQSKMPIHTHQSRFTLLENSELNKRSVSKSPYKNSKKIVGLRQFTNCGFLSQNNYQETSKAYYISLELNQKPFEMQNAAQNIPKMMAKLSPQEFFLHEVQDLADKSNIFRNLKTAHHLSQVFDLQRSLREAMFETQMNNHKFQLMNERSQISYSPDAHHQSSISILNNHENSSFGCEAVNFKNSLVMQRQSMKVADRSKVQIFLKKKTSNSNNESLDSEANLKRRNRPKAIISERKIGSELYNYPESSEILVKDVTVVANFNHNNYRNSSFEQINNNYSSNTKKINSQPNLLFPVPTAKLKYQSVCQTQLRGGQPNYYSLLTSRSSIPYYDQMPERDVGMDISKSKLKNGMNNLSNKEPQSKKFIAIIKK